MFQSIKSILFSTKLTALLLLVFAGAIGWATIIENDFGTPASKALIFNTRWFELIMILLIINLIGNIIKYKLFRLAKASTLMFFSRVRVMAFRNPRHPTRMQPSRAAR